MCWKSKNRMKAVLISSSFKESKAQQKKISRILPARWLNSTASHIGLLYTSVEAEKKSDIMLRLKTLLFKDTFDLCFILYMVQQTNTFQTTHHWNSHKSMNRCHQECLYWTAFLLKLCRHLQEKPDDGIYQILFQYVKTVTNITL